MKPAFHNYLLAHTAAFSILTGLLGSIGIMLLFLAEQGWLIWEWPVVSRILVAAIPIAGLGYIFGIFIWWFLGDIAAKIQGWPFSEGDEVVILAGKHKGTVTRVYEVWETRGQVRLELGEEPKESVTDVFCSVSVTRTDTGQAESSTQ